MNKNKILPKFKSIEEEAYFWDTHDMVDYIKDSKPLKLSYNPISENKESMTIRVQPSLKKKVERMANEYGIPTSTLIRVWMIDKVRDSQKGKKGL